MIEPTNKNDMFNNHGTCKEILYRMIVSLGGVVESNEVLKTWYENTISAVGYETSIYGYSSILYDLSDDDSIYEVGQFIICNYEKKRTLDGLNKLIMAEIFTDPFEEPACKLFTFRPAHRLNLSHFNNHEQISQLYQIQLILSVADNLRENLGGADLRCTASAIYEIQETFSKHTKSTNVKHSNFKTIACLHLLAEMELLSFFGASAKVIWKKPIHKLSNLSKVTTTIVALRLDDDELVDKYFRGAIIEELIDHSRNIDVDVNRTTMTIEDIPKECASLLGLLGLWNKPRWKAEMREAHSPLIETIKALDLNSLEHFTERSAVSISNGVGKFTPGVLNWLLADKINPVNK